MADAVATPTAIPLDAAAGLRAAACLALAGGAAELALAVWAYRKPGFKSVRVRDGGAVAAAGEGGGGEKKVGGGEKKAGRAHPPSLLPSQDAVARASKKTDAFRAAGASPASAMARGGGPSTVSPSGGKAKKADRAEAALRVELLKEMGVAKVKQMVLAMASLFVCLQLILPAFAGTAAVARLPFAPFKLLAGVAHRGLPAGHAPTDAGAMLLFTLVQAGVRPTLQKLIDGGPTRRMADLQQAWGGAESVSRPGRQGF